MASAKPKKKNPRLASGRKRARQDVKLNAANTSLRSKYRTAVKNVEKAVLAGDKTKAAELFASMQAVVDTIADKGMKSFFDHLISEGKMESYRITRCKMGFRSIADMPEFMILMEFTDMGQMDSAFKRVAPLEGELETKHKSFNQFVAGNIQHALFRDFPDTNL